MQPGAWCAARFAAGVDIGLEPSKLQNEKILEKGLQMVFVPNAVFQSGLFRGVVSIHEGRMRQNACKHVRVCCSHSVRTCLHQKLSPRI